ncbi:S8 family peptidase [Clostridium sp.]|uniref:S8 family peptidase n=1 Tax=Clostridium sp. TaxID=1506 RepID=UPI002FC83AEE
MINFESDLLREKIVSELAKLEIGNYVSFIVEYSGDIKTLLEPADFAYGIPVTPIYAVIFLEATKLPLLKQVAPQLILIEPPTVYILSELSPLTTSNIVPFSEGEPFYLTGNGVLVGIIDSGIDYLNKEFTREDGKTRITRIWDQTDSTGTPPLDLVMGSEYNSEDINKALEAFNGGGDPYTIVPEKDVVGHGTEIAGIIGARGFGEVKGAAPDCEFLIVKVNPFIGQLTDELGDLPDIPVYQDTYISLGIKYLIDTQAKIKKPLVIILPFSSNYGGHDGSSAIERIVDYFSSTYKVTFVTGNGNEGQAGTHTSGIINTTGSIQTVEFQIGTNQRSITLTFWCSYPDKVSVGLVSPSGQIIPRIAIKPNEKREVEFIFEKSMATISYFYPENRTGDENVLINIRNVAPGIWKLNLYGDYIVSGIYNIWMNQRAFLSPETRFLEPTNNTTLTIPSTSKRIISTAYYNQTTGGIGEFSGFGYTRDGRIKPDITSGGVNVLTTTVGGGTTTVTGSSAATAVLTGAVALLLQWGIVEGNDIDMHGVTIKSYLIRGARERPDEEYPNPVWGYGTLDLLGVFEALRSLKENRYALNSSNFSLMRNVDVVIPEDINKRLKY